MITQYAVLKHHFDRLLFGGYPNNTGLEPIRDVYQRAFNKPINMHDIYTTQLKVSTNPLSEIITLIGPDDTDESQDLGYPTGIMPNSTGIVHVSIFDDSILKGLSGNSAKLYAKAVHDTMLDIVTVDRFYKTKWHRGEHPYMQFIKAVPLYFAFHHIKECVPCVLDDSKTFEDIIEKYYICNENTTKVYESLMDRKYSEDIEDIISTLSCKNTIEFY